MTMAFHQLYYTSCEHGLLGYGGFQFNAVTPGIPPTVMRQVEDMTSYEPPRSMPGDPRPDQLAGYPVAFCHAPGGASTSITAQVVFTGADYSGRPGNYFAHALVTDSPQDFGPVLPVELWDAPWWRTKPAEVRELPPLPGPPPRGHLDRAAIGEFVDGADDRVLPVLLSAVSQAMEGGRPVLLAGPDTAANARWIAAICYLLGDQLARRLSFTTYSHRPAYARHHLIGVLSGDETVPADETFHVYDTATGRLPTVPVHPLAALLARAGINQADSLWRQAAARASGPAEGLDGWHPAVAAAAVLAGIRLDPPDAEAVMAWLGTAAPAAGVPVLEALVDQEPVSDERGAALHGLAARLRATAVTERLELGMVAAAYVRIGRGEPAGPPVRLTSQAAKDEAASQCVAALDRLPVEYAPALLKWTADAGAVLAPGEFREFGLFLDPAIDADLLGTILTGRPYVVEGLLSRLSAHPDEARDLFTRTSVVGYDEVAGQPRLAEQWVLGARARGEGTAIDAFREIRALRRSSGSVPDVDLLSELWPGECPAGDLRELLPAAAEADAEDWLAKRIGRTLSDDSSHGRAGLAKALDGYPALRDRLPGDLRQTADSLAKTGTLVANASVKVARGDTRVFRELYRSYVNGDRQARKLLDKQIPKLLCQTDRLDLAMRDCPEPVRHAFCVELQTQLHPLYAEAAALGARVFFAMLYLDGRGAAATREALDQALLQQVRNWPGNRRRALRKALNKTDAEEFDRWWEDHHGGALVKIRGLLRRGKDGGQP
jgi:hypothetical protein